MISALFLSLALQADGRLPAGTRISYPSLPMLVVDQTAGRPVPQVRMQLASVTYVLTRENATVRILAVYRNEANVPGTGKVRLDFTGQAMPIGLGDPPAIIWSDEKVAPGAIAGSTSPTRIDGFRDLVDFGGLTVDYPVAIKAKGTHSMRVEFKLPIGRTGLDLFERIIAFRVPGAFQLTPLDQFQMAVQYGSGVVFRTIAAGPGTGWQIGDRGAFVKREDWSPARDTLFTFHYYPDGFNGIAGGR